MVKRSCMLHVQNMLLIALNIKFDKIPYIYLTRYGLILEVWCFLFHLKWVILKYATTHNHPQPSTITHHQAQPPTTIHNHPKITQKSQNLIQAVMLLHLDVNNETDVDFDNDMKQYIYIEKERDN